MKGFLRLITATLLITGLIVISGCRDKPVPRPGADSAPSHTEKQNLIKETPTVIAVIDANTGQPLEQEVEITLKELDKPEISNIYRDKPPVRLFFEGIQRDKEKYHITIKAEGYFPLVEVTALKTGGSVTFALTPLKPLTEENEGYRMLKKAASLPGALKPLPVLKPAYLPPGFKVAPYITDGYGNQWANPDILECKIKYVCGDNWIVYMIGQKGDFGDTKLEYINIRGCQGKLSFKIIRGKPCGVLAWDEIFRGEAVTYALEFWGVPKEEIIKMARSMKEF